MPDNLIIAETSKNNNQDNARVIHYNKITLFICKKKRPFHFIADIHMVYETKIVPGVPLIKPTSETTQEQKKAN